MLAGVQAWNGGDAVNADFEPGDQSDDCNIICPYCGHSRQAEPCDGDAEETPKDDECDECGKCFVRYAQISITYCTKQMEETP